LTSGALTARCLGCRLSDDGGSHVGWEAT
jgi:hypothetical protein